MLHRWEVYTGLWHAETVLCAQPCGYSKCKSVIWAYKITCVLFILLVQIVIGLACVKCLQKMVDFLKSV